MQTFSLLFRITNEGNITVIVDQAFNTLSSNNYRDEVLLWDIIDVLFRYPFTLSVIALNNHISAEFGMVYAHAHKSDARRPADKGPRRTCNKVHLVYWQRYLCG